MTYHYIEPVVAAAPRPDPSRALHQQLAVLDSCSDALETALASGVETVDEELAARVCSSVPSITPGMATRAALWEVFRSEQYVLDCLHSS